MGRNTVARVKRDCKTCSKPFETRASVVAIGRGNFCSHSCSNKARAFQLERIMNKAAVCILCGEMFFTNAFQLKMGWGKLCSRQCANTFKARSHAVARRQKMLEQRAAKKDTYKKLHGKHEHRRIMEAHLGRALTANEIVHHIDHNKHNNKVDNLQLMTRSEHASYHTTNYWREQRC